MVTFRLLVVEELHVELIIDFEIHEKVVTQWIKDIRRIAWLNHDSEQCSAVNVMGSSMLDISSSSLYICTDWDLF